MTKNRDIDFSVFARGAGVTRTFKEKDIVFQEGQPPDAMYLILSGSIEIASHGKFIETIGPGRALGFVSMLDQSPRATTARAVEDCELAVLDFRKFRYMLDEVPNFAWYIMHEMSHRLRMLGAAVEESRGSGSSRSAAE